ncbi:MAG: S41 family peptidase [bacterium]|nr:S41 family peptidase [bacterium]
MNNKFLAIGLVASALITTSPHLGIAQQNNNVGPLGQASIIMDRYHISSPKRPQLETGAIKGMIEALNDPYARYISPEGYQQIKARERGISVGIGATLGYIDGILTVISIIPNGPAEKSGIAPLDAIEQIGRKSTLGMSVDEANSLMQGQPHTKITIRIRRPYIAKPVDLSVIRKAIANRSVTDIQVFYHTIGYIRLSRFTHTAAKEMQDALIHVNQSGIRALILDLRNNGGGDLEQTIAIAKQLFHEGPIIHIKGPKTNTTISANKTAIFAVKPMIVLINKSSASASEVLAAALAENKRAILMGQQSFGKSSVQRVFPLADGSAIVMTVAGYLTPSGKQIEGVGITPSIIVPLQDRELLINAFNYNYVTDAILQKAIDHALLMTQ